MFSDLLVKMQIYYKGNGFILLQLRILFLGYYDEDLINRGFDNYEAYCYNFSKWALKASIFLLKFFEI